MYFFRCCGDALRALMILMERVPFAERALPLLLGPLLPVGGAELRLRRGRRGGRAGGVRRGDVGRAREEDESGERGEEAVPEAHGERC
jgi:hypothetical protein